MELQWPLILFTTLVAWSAGVFGTQAVLALRGEAPKAQLSCWITAAVLLAAGGIAVFFHLEHFERIFNGFGHLTSGITQELIAIVVLAVAAIVYLVYLRRDEGKVPAWLAVLSIALAAVLVVVMAHSYMMSARPAWDSVLWIFYVLGNACVLGPATVALVCAIVKEPVRLAATVALGFVIERAAYKPLRNAPRMSVMISATTVGYYSDPTMPTAPLVDVTAVGNVFTGELAPLMWIGVILVGAVVPLIAALLEKRSGATSAADGTAVASRAELWMAVAVIAAVIGAICMRVVFYELGASVFMLY